MTLLSPSLLSQIRKVAQELPPTILATLVGWLSQPMINSEELCQQLPNTKWRQEVINLLDLWQTEGKSINASALAASLSAAAYCEAESRRELSVELVWTGPYPKGNPLRRTDQALLQLIQSAQRELLIICFAVYKVPEIAEALLQALNRGVSLRLVTESPEASKGKISYGVEETFGQEILKRAEVLIWPLEKRSKNSEGRYGSLHAKCAVADEKWILISSANLTEYAMNLNMELGSLIYSPSLGSHLDKLFQQLTNQKILI